MQRQIIQKLKQLEKDKQIRILFAAETGSRAWGFASPDSDYDVRIIYAHDVNWYVRVSEGKDHLSYMSDDGVLDITGWELRKSLRLLARSNAALFERIQSPIIYLKNDNFAQEMMDLGSQFYSPVAAMHHYHALASKCLDDIRFAHSYKLKTFFYALRATCVCNWIMEYPNFIPPMVFDQILEGIAVTPVHRHIIVKLVALKATKSESYLHSGEDGLMRFMEESLKRAKAYQRNLSVRKGDVELLNTFLQAKTIA